MLVISTVRNAWVRVLSAQSKILFKNIEIILSNQKILHSQLYFSNFFSSVAAFLCAIILDS